MRLFLLRDQRSSNKNLQSTFSLSNNAESLFTSEVGTCAKAIKFLKRRSLINLSAEDGIRRRLLCSNRFFIHQDAITLTASE